MTLFSQTRAQKVAVLSLLTLVSVACTTAQEGSDMSAPEPQAAAEEPAEPASPSTDIGSVLDGEAPETVSDRVQITIPAQLVGENPEQFEQTLASYLLVDPFDLERDQTATEYELSEGCVAALEELYPDRYDQSIEEPVQSDLPEDLPEACVADAEAFGLSNPYQSNFPEITVNPNGSLFFELDQAEHQMVLRNIVLTLQGSASYLPNVRGVSVNGDLSIIRIAVEMPEYEASGDEDAVIYSTFFQAQLYRAISGLGSWEDGGLTIEIVDADTGARVNSYTVEVLMFTNLVPENE